MQALRKIVIERNTKLIKRIEHSSIVLRKKMHNDFNGRKKEEEKYIKENG